MSAELLSLAAAAARIGVCERTLRRHLGELRTYRIGRRRVVSVADLEVWLAGRVAMPAPAVRAGAKLSDPARRLLSRLGWVGNGPRATQPRGIVGRDPLTADQERGR